HPVEAHGHRSGPGSVISCLLKNIEDPNKSIATKPNMHQPLATFWSKNRLSMYSVWNLNHKMQESHIHVRLVMEAYRR
ncbi:hypothetical protein ACJX0J_032657, partial [Zea mays]